MNDRLTAQIASARFLPLAAEIANVTSSSFFIRTAAPFEFGERVEITLFDVTFPGEVAFATEGASNPGAVIVFDAPPAVLSKIVQVRPMTSVIGRHRVEHVTRPLTTADIFPHVTDSIQMPPAEPLHQDLMEEIPPKSPDDTQPEISPEIALAMAEKEIAAMQLGVLVSIPDEPTMPQLEESPRAPPRTPTPPGNKPSPPPRTPSGGSGTAEAPAVVAAASALARAASGVSPPRTASGSGLPGPSGPVARAKSGGLPAPTRAASNPPAKAHEPEPELPELESDGVTLRFASANQYLKQHTANIAHGGIIARSTPIPVGTQRFLGLQIPGKGRYTVSVRVTFVGEGTIGFAIDSFPIHKDKLKAFTTA
jgi:hypothetical protein